MLLCAVVLVSLGGTSKRRDGCRSTIERSRSDRGPTESWMPLTCQRAMTVGPSSCAAPSQVPCIEGCAFGAVKSWTSFMIVSNEIPTNRRVDFDMTVAAMALTAKEMNTKYKETSEGGLAVSVVLC